MGGCGCLRRDEEERKGLERDDIGIFGFRIRLVPREALCGMCSV